MADSGRDDFLQVVEEEFRFLEARGYRPFPDDANCVRYEAPSGVFVRVFRDTNDKYVGYRVGLVARPRDAMTATELSTLSGHAIPRGEYPEHPDELRPSIQRLAQQLSDFGSRALSGASAIYDEAAELRRAHTSKFTKPGR